MRLTDQTATPTAASTSAITTLTMARAAVECSPGGLRPPPGRPPPAGLDLGLDGAASGGGNGLVAALPGGKPEVRVGLTGVAGETSSGTGGAASARASANAAAVLSAGPWRLACWNSARQVTSSTPAGTSADTWRGVHSVPPFSGAGGSSPGAEPAADPGSAGQ